MDICKCIVPLWHGGILNSRRAQESSREVGEKEREVGGHDHLFLYIMFTLKIVMELGQNVLSPVRCSKLSLTTGVHLAFGRDEFRGPRSDIVRQLAILTTHLSELKILLMTGHGFGELNVNLSVDLRQSDSGF
ncbi:hypothetical protein TNCV_2022771 [Trichonephila clavipes]|nr:hypothetical protein TNCV_2022771 [Trichonephila clavipes]